MMDHHFILSTEIKREEGKNVISANIFKNGSENVAAAAQNNVRTHFTR